MSSVCPLHLLCNPAQRVVRCGCWRTAALLPLFAWLLTLKQKQRE